MSIEAMKQALEALDDRSSLTKWQTAREALRQAIEQAEKQEHQINQLEKFKNHVLVNADALGVVLDAPTPKREWVGLTDDERSDIRSRVQEYTAMDNIKYGLALQIATEQALKEKNGWTS